MILLTSYIYFLGYMLLCICCCCCVANCLPWWVIVSNHVPGSGQNKTQHAVTTLMTTTFRHRWNSFVNHVSPCACMCVCVCVCVHVCLCVCASVFVCYFFSKEQICSQVKLGKIGHIQKSQALASSLFKLRSMGIGKTCWERTMPALVQHSRDNAGFPWNVYVCLCVSVCVCVSLTAIHFIELEDESLFSFRHVSRSVTLTLFVSLSLSHTHKHIGKK